VSHHEALTEMLAGNVAFAEERLLEGYEALGATGETSYRSTTAAFIARAALLQGHQEDADRFARVSAELAQDDDVFTQVIWRGVRARLLSLDSALDEAEAIARDAVSRAATTDIANVNADALVDLSAVLSTAGHAHESSQILTKALRLYEQKGNVVSARRTRAELDALTTA
jgi:hypothetical protein